MALLASAAAVALPTGCTSASPPPPVDGNRVLIESAYRVESSLLVVLTADEITTPRALLAEAQQVIQDHLDQLAEVLGGAIPSSDAPSDAPSDATSEDFGDAARAAADLHLAGVVDANPPTSQLLSSLAASDLVLSEAFQDLQDSKTSQASPEKTEQ
jgi:hypothetical protein